jgi:hypothetical protein
VQDGPEDLVEEPGNLEFNAIRETRSKVTPNRERLLATLAELGLSCEVLPVPFGTALGVEHGDDYAAGARITVLCRQVRAARPATPPGGTATLGARPSSAPLSGAPRP